MSRGYRPVPVGRAEVTREHIRIGGILPWRFRVRTGQDTWVEGRERTAADAIAVADHLAGLVRMAGAR
ncbi:hypothetical protein [Pseudonocardia pini]|uniref:hypothetical protein n=1 Tax=Pseudonocardia pini TaxID=2758030 RepID=UPI0015F0A033|nr:hypothetical protein [Pseudonocardia pini]